MANRKLLLKSYLNQLDSYMLNKEYVLLNIKSPYELRRYYNAKKSGKLKSIIIYEKSNHNAYVSVMDKDVDFIKTFLETLEEKPDDTPIDEINHALNELNDTKDRYAFVGYNSDNKTDYLETTLEDIEDIIDACQEAKTLIKKQLKLKEEVKK